MTWPQAVPTEGFEWHDDAAGHEEPRPLSMLYCVESPEVGGETLFLNGAAVLEQLAPEWKSAAKTAAELTPRPWSSAARDAFSARQIALCQQHGL